MTTGTTIHDTTKHAVMAFAVFPKRFKIDEITLVRRWLDPFIRLLALLQMNHEIKLALVDSCHSAISPDCAVAFLEFKLIEDEGEERRMWYAHRAHSHCALCARSQMENNGIFFSSKIFFPCIPGDAHWNSWGMLGSIRSLLCVVHVMFVESRLQKNASQPSTVLPSSNSHTNTHTQFPIALSYCSTVS